MSQASTTRFAITNAKYRITSACSRTQQSCAADVGVMHHSHPDADQMAFVIQPLADTEFYTIGFSALGLREQRIPAKVRKIPWQCAVDNQEDGPSTLATQLVSSSLEMREGLYFYILLIERDPVFLALSFPDAYLLDKGSIEKFPLDYIRETFNAAAEVVTVDNKPFRFPDPELLHSGLSLSL